MKLIFVVNNVNAGGAEAHTLRLAADLARRHEVQIAALSRGDEKRTLDSGSLDVRTNPSDGFLNSIAWLKGVILNFDADVVISVNLKPLVLVQLSGKFDRHVSIFHSFPKHVFAQGAKAGIASLCWLASSSVLSARVSRFIFVCNAQLNAWRFFPPFLLRPSVVVRNGVFVPAIPAMKAKRDPGAPLRIAMVAAFRREKNHRLLLSALQVLHAKGFAFEVVFAGEGPLRSEIESQVEVANLTEKVTFLGSLKNCDHVYKWADVTVLPSTVETLPLVLAESMSFGTPAIASDVGGNRELIESARNGVLFPSGDINKLVAALELASTEQVLAGFSQNARDRVIADFSMEQMIVRYEYELCGR